MPPRELDNADINALVLGLDRDLQQVATWTHLLQDKLDSGEITLPIEDLSGLEPLFVQAAQTTIAGTDQHLRRPEDQYFPPVAFPIDSLDRFTVVANALVRLAHTLGPPAPKD